MSDLEHKPQQKEMQEVNLITAQEKEFILKELKRYEHPYSSLIPCLFQLQKSRGWIAPELVTALSELTEIPEVRINEVLQFYTMFNKEPVGKLHVQVCCNVSCTMNGAKDLVERLCNVFQVKKGEISADGLVTVTPVECLGACDKAPMMQINETYYEDLSREGAVQTVLDLCDELSENERSRAPKKKKQASQSGGDDHAS